MFKENKIMNVPNPPEYLLNNKLDDELKKMFYPLNLMQSLLFNAKYNLQDNFVTPKGKTYNIVSFVACVTLLSLCVYNTAAADDIDTDTRVSDTATNYAYAAYCCVFYYGGFVLLFVINIINANENVGLILTIQDIYKLLDCTKHNRSVLMWNWVAVVCVVGTNIFMFVFYYCSRGQFDIVDFLADIIFMTFDINLVYALRVIILLRIYLNEWSQRVLSMDYEADNFEECEKLFHVYRNILDAYKLYKNVYKVFVLYHTTDTFFRTLCYMQIIIQVLKDPTSDVNPEYARLGSVLGVWLVKDLVLVVVQCVHCELFYICVEDARTACILRVKSTHCTESERELCEQVVQTTQTSYSKMSACGLFDIDAALPASVLQLIANYVVILMQVAFL